MRKTVRPATELSVKVSLYGWYKAKTDATLPHPMIIVDIPGTIATVYSFRL
jgi:hypothetical protein